MPLTAGDATALLLSCGVVVSSFLSRRHARLRLLRQADFVAEVGHELKTPVAALGVLADALVHEEDPSVARRLALLMDSEAFRLAQTVDELLELGRLDNADTTRPVERVAVDDFVTTAINRARPDADRRRVSIDVVGRLPRLVVSGDHRQLVTALYNLLDNAVKYSLDGATIEVAARPGDDGGRGTVAISVRDNGIGIPARELERIFARFYRGERASNTNGTGLGLAIARRVARSHGGEVRVTSREGQGSTFTLLLPAVLDISRIAASVPARA
jgi:two-component system sensor histidine kinase SenX3